MEYAIYTDGACRGNPGPGGYGVVVIDQKNNCIIKTFSETCLNTTNNREELKAIIKAFEIINELQLEEKNICIFSDSAYAVNMINNWIWTWAKNNWKNSKKKEVENIDLVKIIFNYINKNYFDCQVKKINGHAGILGNELADALATSNFDKYSSIFKNSILDTLDE